MEMHDVFKRIIGKIVPVGETYEDKTRLENLKNHIDEVNIMVDELCEVRRYASDYRSSMQTAAKKALEALKELNAVITDTIN